MGLSRLCRYRVHWSWRFKSGGGFSGSAVSGQMFCQEYLVWIIVILKTVKDKRVT
jgi:hypothetical protein